MCKTFYAGKLVFFREMMDGLRERLIWKMACEHKGLNVSITKNRQNGIGR